MPKPGFRSVTIPDSVYERFLQAYEEEGHGLAMRGVNSLSGYVAYVLDDFVRRRGRGKFAVGIVAGEGDSG